MAALLFLGFSSGLPFMLTNDVLKAWLTVENIDLATIGLFSLVALPYSFKWAWSPLIDRYVPPIFGRRRGWIFLMQVALLISIAAMGLQNPTTALRMLSINAFLVAFFSATQDVAVDAYRTDVLDEHEMGAGAALFVLGYRVALLVSGAFAFMLADRLSWPVVYVIISLLMLPGMIANWRAPEPKLEDKPPQTLVDAVVLPFRDFFQRAGLFLGAAALLFIVLFKLPDYLGASLRTPFLVQTGFSETEIGAILGGIGLGATIFGALFGGAVVARLGINRSLWIFGLLQVASNLMYYFQAVIGKSNNFLILTMVVENFCTGLVTAGFVAFLMSLCSIRFSATQYALLSSLMSASRDIVVAPFGGVAESVGWSNYFLITIAAGIPGLLLLPLFAPWNRDSPLMAARHTGETVSPEEAARLAHKAGREEA
ncbi:MAG TPA: AmpG family muropeptide MFS transporter [Longimicrobiales bacterium]|nr:AmpG family muropeptide MFS transporter [Longimicrobiales bacterium]